MRKIHSIMAVVICAVTILACKKSATNATSGETQMDTSLHFSVPITRDQAAVLDTLARQGKITGPADFKKKVDSLLKLASENGSQHTALDIGDDPSSYVPGFDIGNAASLQIDQPILLGGGGGYQMFQTTLEIPVTYLFRQNTMTLEVPLQIIVVPSDGGYNIMQSIDPIPFERVNILGDANCGQMTQNSSWFINSQYTMTDQSRTLDAEGNATEQRTEIFSVEGDILISTNPDVSAFPVGSVLEPGFTVSSAINIFNTYQIDLNSIISVSGNYCNECVPFFSIYGTISATQNGISKNK